MHTQFDEPVVRAERAVDPETAALSGRSNGPDGLPISRRLWSLVALGLLLCDVTFAGGASAQGAYPPPPMNAQPDVQQGTPTGMMPAYPNQPTGMMPAYPNQPMGTMPIYPNQLGSDVSPKNPLILAIMSPVVQQAAVSLASGIGSLFSRLFASATTPSQEAKSAAAPAVAPAYPPITATMGSPGAMPPGPIGAMPPGPIIASAGPDMSSTVAKAAFPSFDAKAAAATPIVPALVVAVDQVDPQSFQTIGQLDVKGGSPTLRTGDVFAIRFATNLPGLVKIENVDAQGVVSDLSKGGAYQVIPGRDNRIPRTKGMKLVGDTGLEIFTLNFYPCMPNPPPPEGLPASLQGRLLDCSTVADKQLGLNSANAGMVRSAVNLEVEDHTILAGAVTDFTPTNVIRLQFTVQHVASQ
jgi:hypothetical protein